MKRISVVCTIIGLLAFIGCTQPTNSGGNPTGGGTQTFEPNLPVSVGNNPFAGKTFILYDRNNEVDEKIVFSDNGYTVWELEDDQWEPALQGVYSYNVSLEQIYVCITLIYDDASGWITIAEYIDNVINSNIRNQKAGALRCGLDINAAKSEIKSAFLSWFSEPYTKNYTIDSIITAYNTTGYKLQVAGVYDALLPWYNQRNGSYSGESSSETDCNIEDGDIGWGGSITYYDSSYYYFITDVTDTMMYFMDVLENQTSHQYTKNGSGGLAEITLYGSRGSVVLTWKSLDDFN